MRPKSLRPSLLLLLVLVPALGIWVHGGLREWKRPVGSAVAQESPRPPRAWEEAVDLFEQKRYREVLERLESLDESVKGLDPRERSLLHGAATIRLARVKGTQEGVEKALLELIGVISGETDEIAGRALLELVGTGYSSHPNVQPRIHPFLTAWENSPDVEQATESTLSLLESMLEAGNFTGTTVLRMWENLVAIEANAERLRAAGSRLLSGRDVPVLRADRNTYMQGWRHGHQGDRVLMRRVATDLLELGSPAWLRGDAHLRLGMLADEEQSYRSAAAHYEAVLVAVDASESWAATEATQRLTQLRAPQLSLNGPQLFRPGSAHAFTAQWRNLGGWDLTIRRVSPTEEARKPGKTSPNRRDLAQLFEEDAGNVVLQRAFTDDAETKSRAKTTIATGEPHRVRSESVWIDALDPGLYFATLTPRSLPGDDAPKPAVVPVIVSDIGLTSSPIVRVSDGADALELWAVNMESGEPLSGLSLRAFIATRRDRTNEVDWSEVQVKTDADGLAYLEGITRRNTEWMVVLGENDGSPLASLIPSLWWNQLSREPEMRGFVWSDRPLYRPGETVHLQAFARQMNHAERKVRIPDQKRSLRLVVTSPDGQVFHESQVTLDENGSVELGLELPNRPALGVYSVHLGPNENPRWNVYGNFHVDEIRLPEFTVNVELDDERRVVMGDTLQVDVKAEYLFGGPVQGQAEVVVTRTPVWVHWRPWSRFDWMESDVQPMHSGMPKHGRMIAPYYGGGEEVLRTEITLDEDGRARVAIPTVKRDSQGQDYDYSVEARVIDSSRREEKGRANVRVTQQELYAFLHVERHLVAPGDRATVTLRVQDGQGRGVAHAGEWALFQQEDNRGQERRLFDRKVTTDANGEATLDFEPEKSGYYTIRYRSRDSRGEVVRSEASVWCADPRTRDISHGAGALSLIVEEDEIRGDTARVLLVTDTPGIPILLSRTHAGGTVTELIRPKGTAQLLQLPIDALHRPAFELRATTVREFRVHEAAARVVAPEAPRLLDVELSFDDPEYMPGRLAPLQVRVKDADGNPVSTLLSLAVVDEAVLAVKPRDLPDLVQLFHGFRQRPAPMVQLTQAWMGGFQWVERKEGDETGPRDDWEQDDFDVGLRQQELRENSMGNMSFDAAPEGQAKMRMAGRTMADAAMPASLAAPGEEPVLDVALRSDFRTTALWRTAIQTDADGTARIDVPLAESLTSWKATGVALDPETRVGTADATTRTRKPFMVRLNHPRVFRDRDAFALAATVHNDTDEEVEAMVQLRAEGLELAPHTQKVLVPAHGQTRVEWKASVSEGAAALRFERDENGNLRRTLPSTVEIELAAETEVHSDGLKREVDLYPYGSPLHLAASAELGSGDNRLRVTLPDAVQAGSTRATLAISPSILSSLAEALPYLADFPYGCTEQTLSRFVPAAAVAAVAEALGVDPKKIDPQLEAKIAEGLDRIADMQQPDGGWSWWKQGDPDPYMTSYVLVALSTALEAGVDDVPKQVLERGRQSLRAQLTKLEKRPDDMAYALYALGLSERALGGRGRFLQDETMARFASRLVEGRDELRPYARALLALTLHLAGDVPQAELVLRHLSNDVERDTKVNTAHWGRTGGYWWRGDGAVEATAFAVKAFGAIDPDSELRAAAVRWLVANRRGHRWDSTRSTAHAIYALVDVAREEGELSSKATIVVRMGDTEVGRVQLDGSRLLDGPTRLEVPGELFDAGNNDLRIEMIGEGRAYATLEVDTYSQAEKIEAAGHWLEVERELIRLQPLRTLGGSILQIEHPMKDGDAILSGDRLRVRLTIVARQDVDYVAIEDPRPAGTEPVEVLSGRFGSGSLYGRREVRDELTGFFVSTLREGTHVLDYELRAESPGTYNVGPARAWGMYLPDVSGHSASNQIAVEAVELGGAR